jgi:hypothetical protein
MTAALRENGEEKKAAQQEKKEIEREMEQGE